MDRVLVRLNIQVIDSEITSFYFTCFSKRVQLPAEQLTIGGFHVGVRPVCKQVTVCVVVVPGQVHVTLVLTGYCPVRLGGQGVGGAEQPAIVRNIDILNF